MVYYLLLIRCFFAKADSVSIYFFRELHVIDYTYINYDQFVEGSCKELAFRYHHVLEQPIMFPFVLFFFFDPIFNLTEGSLYVTEAEDLNKKEEVGIFKKLLMLSYSNLYNVSDNISKFIFGIIL